MQTQEIITASGERAQVIGGGGRGFRLEPLCNVLTRNPVAMRAAVRLNRNDSRTLGLGDDAPRYFAEGFEALELLGGAAGDQWRVTLYDTVEDADGAPARSARHVPIIAMKTAWTPGEQVSGRINYLTGPGCTQTASGVDAGQWLDVSAYDALVLYAEANDADETDAGYSLNVKLEFYADFRGRCPMETVERTGMQLDGSVWKVSVRAGTPPTGDAAWASVARRYPCVRVSYFFTPGAEGKEFTGALCLSGLPRG